MILATVWTASVLRNDHEESFASYTQTAFIPKQASNEHHADFRIVIIITHNNRVKFAHIPSPRGIYPIYGYKFRPVLK
jgi:hypothetical protein